MANTVVKIGKMASTNVDSYLETVQLSADTPNGAHVVLGTQIDANTWNAAAATDVTKQEVLILEAPVLVEINGYRIDVQDPTQFVVPANRPARARHLKYGDTLTISIDGFSTAPTVGQYAVPANGATTLAPAVNLSGNTTLAYSVLSRDDISVGQGFLQAYKLQVIKSF